MFNRTYSLAKSHQIMKSSYKWYAKRGKSLQADDLRSMENHLEALDQAILAGNRARADEEAHFMEGFCKERFKKNQFEYAFEVMIAIVVALLVATVIRASWFELYEIPSGSMRPTFAEQDRLTVSKTTFGINVPLETAHFMFEPENVKRTGVFIWSGDGIAHLDSDSTFMGLFPYTKRYIKRCMGKPGDLLYFYGGKLYGMDAQEKPLEEFIADPLLNKIDHVPFLYFEGRRSYGLDKQTKIISEVNFNHFNLPIGRYLFEVNKITGQIFNGKEWIQDNATAQLKSHNKIETLSDFFGMRNYAVSRLLTKQEVERLTPFKLKDVADAPLYLELRHTPSLSYPAPAIFSNSHTFIRGYSTLLPLQQAHIDQLMANMYTCRFTIKNGKGASYSSETRKMVDHSPSFPDVPDGTYEFYYGKARRVGWAAITHALAPDHPLYSRKPAHVQKLYNVGIEMSTYFEPQSKGPDLFPNRYTYFRDGDLYTMGGILMKKEDPILKAFLEKELAREKASTEKKPYVAFKDYGAPVDKEGKLDLEFIKIFGYKVPEKHYLALGDNHAMSSDSRMFGPIPEANLQGTPSLILWPPGERWGLPNQPRYPFFTTSRLIVWSIVAVLVACWYAYKRYSRKKPVYRKL